MNATETFSAQVSTDRSLPRRLLMLFAALLVAAPWFWPILAGPLPAMLPDIFAWTCGALLVGLFPWIRGWIGWIVAWGLVVAAVGSSLLALIQYFDYDELFGIWIALTPPGYVTANVHQTNMLATLLASGVWALWYLTKTRQLMPVLATALGAFVLTAMAATASRTGMIQLILFCCVVIYWSPSQRRAHVMLALALSAFYLAIAQLLPWLLEVLRGITIDRNLLGRFSGDVGCSSRKVVWANVLHLISLKPWLGWGAGELMYAQYITLFDGVRYCEKMSNAHNIFLQMAVTMGLPFAITGSGLATVAFFKIKPWKAIEPRKQLGWGILMAIAFHSMVEYPVWFGVFQMLIIQAILLLVIDEKQPLPGPDTRVGVVMGSKPMAWVAASFAFLSLLAFVSWDYLKVSQLYLPLQWRLAYYKEDTLNRTRDTVLFKSHVLIAQVVTTPATSENAERLLAGALESLRTAPDPRVIKQVITAASMAARYDLVVLHSERFQAAWPKDYAEWEAAQGAVHPTKTNK
ncbi:PglL family O-oligosaccharyltransferase [Hydrogenophaga sp.]|uniref:PglL family O-oligosaccharyltransferase n=1 Tax=Hydrogenophaga sp. TaxID=1904254 RepID=UPI002FC77020